jgi:hypothetical protein
MDIQAEAIDPSCDIFEQVVQILTKLVDEGTLKNKHKSSILNIPGFFRAAFSSLFALDQLDFYFDLELAYMDLAGLSCPLYPNTRYSSDRPCSSLKTYDKRNRLIQKNHLPHELINAIKYPQRIEFSLKRENCDYLNGLNLQGSYQEVFARYLPFLGKKWRKYSHEILNIPDGNLPPYAAHLWHIIVESSQCHIPNSGLERTPPKPIPYKTARKNEADWNWLVRYFAGSTQWQRITRERHGWGYA